MNGRTCALALALAAVPLNPLFAESARGPVSPTPYVESAFLEPTNVEVPDLPNPAVRLRLEDPAKGGVLYAGYEGVALLPGPSDEESFVARVEIEFLEANTSVEVRVVDADGAQLNSVVVSSPKPGRWTGDLCQVGASQNSRMELSVRTGTALGTAYRVGREYVTTVPILGRATMLGTRGGTLALATATSLGRTPLAPGYSNYSRNYSWPGTSFSYVVTSGPPNSCGELHTFRNGSWLVSWSCWMYTDASGHGVVGPWNITTTYPGQNQTDNPSYIKWPDGTVTTSTWSVVDTFYPTITIASTPALFHGTGTAASWGLGFSTVFTSVLIWYQDTTSGYYWDNNHCDFDGFCYTSGTPIYFNAPTDMPTGQAVFQLNWHYYSGGPACRIGHHCSFFAKITNSIGDPFGNSAQQAFQYQ